jgi:hypothetical protein
MRSASAELMGSASMSNSVALACPTSRGSVQDAAVSAARPTLAKAIRKAVFGPPTRKSARNARPAPAPAAMPRTAAITGLGIPAIRTAIRL